MTYKRKAKINTITGILFILAFLLAIGGGELIKYVESNRELNRKPLLIPYSDTGSEYDNALAVVHVDNGETTGARELSGDSTLTVSQIVEKEVKKFAKSTSQESYLLYLTHCLLYKESAHGSNKGFGDNFKAGGVLQFHEGTYSGYRNLMIKQGVTNHVGSRMNYEDAIETFLWATTSTPSRLKAWGPALRGECGR